MFAWAFRYPGDAEAPAREEVVRAIDVAREVLAATLARMPAEVRP